MFNQTSKTKRLNRIQLGMILVVWAVTTLVLFFLIGVDNKFSAASRFVISDFAITLVVAVFVLPLWPCFVWRFNDCDKQINFVWLVFGLTLYLGFWPIVALVLNYIGLETLSGIAFLIYYATFFLAFLGFVVVWLFLLAIALFSPSKKGDVAI